ncbi:VMAP-C domain-containing protein, partial [Nostoc sp.]|uniref:VMAP-C domain-containing protein n=1 Tax=Nostoc sp. TaxID=1180 RepID=UPI002FF9B2A3
LVSEQARNDLVKILEKIISSNEEEEGLSPIKDACRKALPKSKRHHALSINEIEQALNLLDKYPLAKDGIPRIIHFASHLSHDEYVASDDALISEIHHNLSTWLIKNNFENPSFSRHELLPSPEPRLFIVVEESMTKGLLGGSNQEQFSVQAWLVPNFPCVILNREITERIYKADEYYVLNLSYLFSIYGDEIPSCISNNILEKIKETEVDGAMHTTNLALLFEELKELLSLFLSEAILLLTEEDPNNEQFEIGRLAIELFLPERLLCSSDVDKWIVYDVIQKNEYSLGATFKVLLHNLARFTKRQAKRSRIEAKKAQPRNTLQESLWKVNWRLAMDKLQTPLSSNEFVLINTDSDLDKDSLQSKLEGKIGVVLGQIPQRDDVLKSIIAKAGIPIVLWTRYDGLEVDHSSEMHELICIMPLIDLPERVFNKRREAIVNKQLVSHLGHHLAVLWDDPNRFPPSDDNLKFPA